MEDKTITKPKEKKICKKHNWAYQYAVIPFKRECLNCGRMERRIRHYGLGIGSDYITNWRQTLNEN